MADSLLEQIAGLSTTERKRWVDSLPEQAAEELSKKPWWFIGRPEQQAPETDWHIWLILSGRGWGKTRTGSEWLAQQIRENPVAADGSPTEWAIVAPTFGLARDVCVEGPSGFLRVIRDEELRYWNRSHGTVLYANGCKVHCFGADNRDAGRGKNLAGAWLDEFAMWPYPAETWAEGLAPSLRIGNRPRAVVTTTPKPIKILRDWAKREDGSVYVTTGSTFDNAANLSGSALAELQARYAGTRTGRQELYGEILEDIEGALWTMRMIEESRLTHAPEDLSRIVVAIDPAVTAHEESDETGIVVAGRNGRGEGYVLADYSFRGSPLEWAQRAVDAYRTHQADGIVVEVNNGGDMIPAVIKQIDYTIPIREVRATRGKKLRAEPIAAFYEQGRVHHIGVFEKLEEQMTTWTPELPKSPDRLDALVWALTDLLETSSLQGYLSELAIWCDTCNLPMPKTHTTCSKCGMLLRPEDEPPHALIGVR